MDSDSNSTNGDMSAIGGGGAGGSDNQEEEVYDSLTDARAGFQDAGRAHAG